MHLQASPKCRAVAPAAASQQRAGPLLARPQQQRQCSSVAAAAAAAAGGSTPFSSSSSSSSSHDALQQHHAQLLAPAPQPQQQRVGRRASAAPTCAAAAAAASMSSMEELVGPDALEPEVFEIVTYALKLAWTSETYYVHSWMLLLGLLKKEGSMACEVLRELGLEDIYGAWNEVLWALNVSDGLTPRAFAARMAWGERASLILQGAVRYGLWAGRARVTTCDVLMAFAASDVLASLFPDLDLSFERVRRAVEKKAGGAYEIPGLDEGREGSALTSQDAFL